MTCFSKYDIAQIQFISSNIVLCRWETSGRFECIASRDLAMLCLALDKDFSVDLLTLNVHEHVQIKYHPYPYIDLTTFQQYLTVHI